MEARLPTPAIRRLYDRLAPTYDWLTAYEARAVRRGIELLDLRPGLVALNVGAGTGREHQRIIRGVSPGGSALGIDIAFHMLNITRRRTGGIVCQGDAAALPFRDSCADRLFASYLLDLIPTGALGRTLDEFRRVLKPDGRLVVVSLTEGSGPFSRLVIRLWNALYAISPTLCGGCRPLRLSALLVDAGWSCEYRETLVQLGVPAEIVVASRDRGPGK